MTPRELLEALAWAGVDLSHDGDNLRFKATSGPVPPELFAALKANKAAVLALLRSLPVYTAEQHAELSAWYCIQDRATRVRITRRRDSLRDEDGVPDHVAFALATDCERTGFNPRLRLGAVKGAA